MSTKEKSVMHKPAKVVGVRIVLVEPRRLAGDQREAGFVLFEGQPVNGLSETDINKALCANAARAMPIYD